MQRKSAVIDDITTAARRAPMRRCSPSTAASRSPTSPNLRAALRPASTDYKIFKNTLARRAATDAGLRRARRAPRGPGRDRLRAPRGGDAVTAAKALRDFAKTNPNLVVKGGMLGDRGADDRRTSRPSPTCRPARCCSPSSPAGSRPRSSRRPACSRPSPATSPTASRPTSTQRRRRRGARRARRAAKPPRQQPPSPKRAATEPSADAAETEAAEQAETPKHRAERRAPSRRTETEAITGEAN